MKKLLLAAIFLIFVLPVKAQVPVTTQAYDLNRSGANQSKTILNLPNVSFSQFGRLFADPLDSEPYGQPLYVPGLTIAGALHNVIYIATPNNTVYAFDADTAGSPLWSVSLGPTTTLSLNSYKLTAGVLSTPVIDTASGTLFTVSLTSGPTYKLHALSLTTGAEEF